MIESIENEHQNDSAGASSGSGRGRGAARVLIFVGLVVAAAVGWKCFGPGNALARAGWTDDWDRAAEQSQRDGKPLLALFTADWCPACRTFKGEVLAQDEVKQYLRENYTLVVVDLSDRSGPEARRASDCNVRAIPTMILFDANGDEAARSHGMPADALIMWLRSAGTGVRVSAR